MLTPRAIFPRRLLLVRRGRGRGLGQDSTNIPIITDLGPSLDTGLPGDLPGTTFLDNSVLPGFSPIISDTAPTFSTTVFGTSLPGDLSGDSVYLVAEHPGRALVSVQRFDTVFHRPRGSAIAISPRICARPFPPKSASGKSSSTTPRKKLQHG
jgi:hypothetical protein